MRIAVVADAFPTVSETFVIDQARRLAEAGHEVVVVGSAPTVAGHLPPVLAGRVRTRRPAAGSLPGRLAGAVAAVLRVTRRSPRRGWRLALALTRADAPLGLAVWAEPLVLAGELDAVISHFGWNARRTAQVRAALGDASLVAVLHGADLSSWAGDQGPERFGPVFACTDLLLPVSERWRDQLLAWGAPPERVAVHRVGIDLQRIEPAGSEAGHPVRLLSIARLVEKKGIADAVRAVALVPDVVYDVIGDGPLRTDLESLIAELGVTDRVRLLGSQPPAEVARRLRQTDVLVAPSITAADGDQEGIPVAIMEAMAAGLPVVSTFHSGIPELVEHERTGLLVHEGDVEALAAALRALVAEPERRRAMGAAGREVVAAGHDAERLARALDGHLEALRRH